VTNDFYARLDDAQLEEMYSKYFMISRLNQLARNDLVDRRVGEREAHAEDIMLNIELTGRISPGRREELKQLVRLEIHTMEKTLRELAQQKVAT
jgi:hypothetical protein